MNKKDHILIIDDDPDLLELLARYLSREEFITSLAESTHQAKRLLNILRFDLIILDYMMPEEDGMTFLEKMRARHDDTPILMLTAKNEDQDRIDAFERGVNDYLGKSFDPRELVFRIRNLLRQQQPTDLMIGSLRLCPESGTLWNGEVRITLSASQKSILLALARAQGDAVSRDQLRLLLRSNTHNRSVDTQITRLREKLAPYETQGQNLITAVRGQGYRLNIS